MASARRVAPWLRAAFPMLAVALVVTACGDDDSGKRDGKPQGGSGNAGASTSSGGSSANTGDGGQAGAPTPGAAGQPEAGGSPGEGGEGGSAAGPDGLSFDELCDLLTVRVRQWFRDCRTHPNTEEWWGVINVDQLCDSGRAAVEAGRLAYDPVQAKACAELSVGGCNNMEAFAYGVRPDFLQGSACEGVLRGVLELGDECHPDSTNYAAECVQGFCAPTACPSTCTDYAEAEEACDGVTNICNPATLFCNAQNVCQPFVAPGQPCPERDECAPGDVCHDVANFTYLCTTPVAVGEDCDPVADVCADRAVCFEGKCTAKVELGETCLYSNNCPEGTYCNGTCRAFVGLDADCSFDACAAGLVCFEGVCHAEGQVGDDCPCEVGLWCDDGGKCRAPGAVGQDCSMMETNSCPVPLFCHPQTLKCTERAAENESCSVPAVTDSCQQGLHCVCTQGCGAAYTAQGTCQPRGAVGADCAAWHDCASGVCTQQKCAEDPLCY